MTPASYGASEAKIRVRLGVPAAQPICSSTR